MPESDARSVDGLFGLSGSECEDELFMSLPSTTPSFSPSLISLMVPVDVKHHVEDVALVEFMYLVFTRMPAHSEHRFPAPSSKLCQI